MLFLSTLMMFINIHEFKRRSFGVSAVAITILQAIYRWCLFRDRGNLRLLREENVSTKKKKKKKKKKKECLPKKCTFLCRKRIRGAFGLLIAVRRTGLP